MTEEDYSKNKIAIEHAKLLWDKWKHHDGLAYGRVQQFLQMQSFVVAGAILGWVNEKLAVTFLMLATGIGLSLFYLEMFMKDMRVRNAFNAKLVKAFNAAGIDLGIEDDEPMSWNPESTDHIVNLWHVNPMHRECGSGRSSREAILLMTVIGGVECALFIVLLSFTICKVFMSKQSF